MASKDLQDLIVSKPHVKKLETFLCGIFSAPRVSNKSITPDLMSSSCYTPRSNVNSPLMTQSLDPSVLNQTIMMNMELKGQQNGIAEKNLEGKLFCTKPNCLVCLTGKLKKLI